MQFHRRPKVTTYFFVALWELAPNADVVAAAVQRSLPVVLAWARKLKRAGVNLKDMPSSPAANACSPSLCPASSSSRLRPIGMPDEQTPSEHRE
jgi:hypothetical protein